MTEGQPNSIQILESKYPHRPEYPNPPTWMDKLKMSFLPEEERYLKQKEINNAIKKAIRNFTDEELNLIAIESASGRVYLQGLLPGLTAEVVDDFNGFYRSKNIYTFFVFSVSSLYYQYRNGEISQQKARKRLEQIITIFQKPLKEIGENDFYKKQNYFDEHFGIFMEEGGLEIPSDLLEILKHPYEENLKLKFKSLFGVK
jgi:hypothetical protein